MQPLNTSFPICFTFEPIVTVVSFFAFLNTEFEIFTTLYFVFPTVIVAGMLTVLSDAFFEFDAYSTPVILFDDLIYLYVTFPILTFFASLVFVLSFLLSLLPLLLLSFLFGLSSSSSSLLSGCSSSLDAAILESPDNVNVTLIFFTLPKSLAKSRYCAPSLLVFDSIPDEITEPSHTFKGFPVSNVVPLITDLASLFVISISLVSLTTNFLYMILPL